MLRIGTKFGYLVDEEEEVDEDEDEEATTNSSETGELYKEGELRLLYNANFLWSLVKYLIEEFKPEDVDGFNFNFNFETLVIDEIILN
ncbi:unnamed protein product [[Candida] boidinii]|nr:unnamed protein product [[Candida] boidinii]